MFVGRQMLQCLKSTYASWSFIGIAKSSGRIYLLFGNSFCSRTVVAAAAENEVNLGQSRGSTPFGEPNKPSENIQRFDAPFASAK